MEALLGIVVIVVIYALIGAAIKAVGAGARAAVRTATGKGSFGANFEASFSGMGPLETRLRAEQVDGDHSFLVQRVEAKGLFPVTHAHNLAFSASIFDITERQPDGEARLQPVLCFIEGLQEPETICYGDRIEVGQVKPDHGWVDWQGILNVVPEALVAPRLGRRRFRVFVLAFDPLSAPTLRNGYLVDGTPLAGWTHDFEWNVENEGYLERSEKQERAEELIVCLAVAVAFADDAMHDAEGKAIQSWMSRRLQVLDDDDRAARRNRFNTVMQEAYAAGRAGRLEVGKAVDELKAVASSAARTEAVELCLDVMSADGVAGDSELRVVNAVAQRLEVDLERFEGLRDKRLAVLSTSIRSDADFHALLNIDPAWDKNQVRTHLNRLYAQWNSRAEVLQGPEKRAQAEKMLEVIARARETLTP